MPVLNEWLLTAQRVAVHLPTRTAVVADLHLGYAEARLRRGDAVPNESMTDLLEPLRCSMQHNDARRLIVAGDLLEDCDCSEALADFRNWLDQSDMELVALVPGNHDIGLESSMKKRKIALPIRPEGVDVGGWRIVHGEGSLPDAPLVHGHFHPYLRWSPKRQANRPRLARGRFAPDTIDGPCYLSGAGRLILPAFSKEAAGVNVLSVRRWRSLDCHAIAGDRVLDLGDVSTLRRRLSLADSEPRPQENTSL